MPRTTRVLLPFVFALLSAFPIPAQSFDPFATPTPTPAPKPTPQARVYGCPSMTVQPLNRRQIRDGQTVGFVANISGGDPKVMPNIIWSTSAGTITTGQGSRQITLDTTGAGSSPDRMIKVDVWVGGYAAECMLQGSASARIIPSAIKFGDFGKLSDEAEKKNLKTLADYMAQVPDNVWLIVYAGRDSARGFAYTQAKKMKDELVANGVPSHRIISLDGGYMEKPLFDFWIVPFGAQPPRPNPTIDRSEIMNARTQSTKPQS
ncbi:MAG TPA: hypothetical protein VGJ02_07950 [Pyrinomonadaceae bacterium]